MSANDYDDGLEDNSLFLAGKEDCSTIIKKLIKNSKACFHDFVKIWNEMRFVTIFQGHPSFNTLLTFTEELLISAKEFCLPPYDFLIRRAGIYLLYSLYYVQPLKDDNVPFVKIRITVKECASLMQLIEECKQENYRDAIYMMSKMLSEGAFLYTATPQVHCLTEKVKKYSQKLGKALRQADVTALLNSKFVQALGEAYQTYREVKQNMNEEGSSSTVDYADSSFADKFISVLEEAKDL